MNLVPVTARKSDKELPRQPDRTERNHVLQFSSVYYYYYYTRRDRTRRADAGAAQRARRRAEIPRKPSSRERWRPDRK